MENRFLSPQKDSQRKEDSSDSLSGDKEFCEDSSDVKSRRLVRRLNSQRSLILSVRQLLSHKSCVKNSFFQRSRGLDTKIPKHVVTLDERYLRRCLELINLSALKAAQCDASVSLGFAEMGILWDDMNRARTSSVNMCDFVSESPLVAGPQSVMVSSEGQWIVGSIMCSQSMINILKSPLLNKYGMLETDDSIYGSNLHVDNGPFNYDFESSPGVFSSCSSQKQGKEVLMLRNYKNGSDTDQKRFASQSSSNSSCSDHSLSPASASTCMGMLQCIWQDGNPHFVFSIDDKKEVYVVDVLKIDSKDHKALDYVYSFYWSRGGRKELEFHGNESLVGKMKVSTSFGFCPNNSRIMQTEFTLFGNNEDLIGEMQTSGYDLRKNKGLGKKVGKVFKTINSSKQRSLSMFGGSSAILENSHWEPSHDVGNNKSDAYVGGSLFENYLPPNLEVAAIVVKEHLPDNQQKEVGGWGMKFLKKASVQPMKTSAPSACCSRDTGDCSTSMDVIIPAGFHGGPRTRNGGPSGLISRWRSGGNCDCGGWDLGCPLTILNTRLRKKRSLSQTDTHDECMSVEFSIQVYPFSSSCLITCYLLHHPKQILLIVVLG